MRTLWGMTCAWLVLLAVIAGPARAASPGLDALIADYESWSLGDDPFEAGRRGDREALARLPDPSPAADARRKAALSAFLTALEEPEQKLRAFQSGAVDYITKPVHVPEVLARVAAHLQIRSLQKSLADELALRIEAEAQLSQSLDRAVVLADATGRIAFSTRFAEDLLHKHFPARAPGTLPVGLETGTALVTRRFSEPGRNDLQLFVLEEKGTPPGPAALMTLGLTAREAEVLYWIAQGKSNPDTATILGASVRTVHKHVEHIFQKLGLETRNAATVTALEVLRPGRP